MELVSKQEFLHWAGPYGIGFDEKHQGRLVFKSANHHRMWDYPEIYRPQFVEFLLEQFEPWTHCWIWKEYATWQLWPNEEIEDRMWSVVLRGLGVPPQDDLALKFSRSEIDSIVTLVFMQMKAACSVCEDILMLPDSGDFICKFSHHDMLIAYAASQEKLDTLAERLAKSDLLDDDES